MLFKVNIDKAYKSFDWNYMEYVIDVSLFKYLGLLIYMISRRKETWKPVIDLVKSRLSSWSNSQLSIGGCDVLIKSIISSLPNYFISFFKVPSGILFMLESLFKQFL